jgi:hypothetical protein
MGTQPVQLLPSGYYNARLTSMYYAALPFHKWLLYCLSIADDIGNCIASIPGAFDLSYAVGAQLDILGQIIGISRTVPFQPSGGVSPVLDDDTYRLLLQATIANNHWDGTIGSLYPIWNTLFPGGQITIIDNQNMTATIVLTGSFTSIIQDLISNGMIVPRPQAVEYTYEFGTPPYFGFDLDNAFIAGFDTGKWS